MSSESSQHSDALAPWDGPLYAANTGHHRRYDDEFVASLPVRPGDRVLDVGCGSGDFTATVAGLVPEGHVVGLDPQPSMIEEARARGRANQTFVLGPAQAIGELVEPGSVDLAFSRSVLHWLSPADQRTVHAAVAGALRPGGAWRVECGGGDNVREVVALLDDIARPFGADGGPWTFRHAGDVLDELLGLGWTVDGGWVRTVAQRRAFDRDGVLGWLESQCVQAYEQHMPADDAPAFRAAVADRVDELRRADGSFDVTFVRLDLLAFSPT